MDEVREAMGMSLEYERTAMSENPKIAPTNDACSRIRGSTLRPG